MRRSKMVSKARKIKKTRINPMNIRSNKELIFGHAILHKWWKKPKTTSWTKAQIKNQHAKLVKIMEKRGFTHKSPLVKK